jgi:hypothetical protein
MPHDDAGLVELGDLGDAQFWANPGCGGCIEPVDRLAARRR